MIARTAAQSRFSDSARLACLLSVFFFITLAPALHAQSEPAGTPPPSLNPPSSQHPVAADSSQEMNTRDSPIPFSVRVNLVPVRVVVRDAQGHTVPNLREDDFKVFEDHKPQLISHFSVETAPVP